jgi:hypothetical protein
MSDVVLRFNDPKDARRLHRNLMKGKGTVLSSKHIGGFSFGDTFKNVGKQILKSDVAKKLVDKGIKTAVNKGADFIESRTGNTGIASSIGNTLGNVASQQAQQQMDKAGEGIKRRAGRPKKGTGAKSNKASNKSLKIPKDLEMYNSIYTGGSFMPLG